MHRISALRAVIQAIVSPRRQVDRPYRRLHQTTASVTVFYFNLPANTELFLRNVVDGGELMAPLPS